MASAEQVERNGTTDKGIEVFKAQADNVADHAENFLLDLSKKMDAGVQPERIFYEQVAQSREKVRLAQKGFNEAYDPVKRAALEAWQAATGFAKKVNDRWNVTIAKCDTITLRWEKMERDRLEAINRAVREEEERKAAEKREAEIQEAETKGAEPEEIAALCQEPVTVEPAPQLTFERAAGISVAIRWDVEVQDIRKLARAVVDGKAPVTVLEANEPALKRLASAMKEEFNIPGVRAFKVEGVRGNTRR